MNTRDLEPRPRKPRVRNSSARIGKIASKRVGGVFPGSCCNCNFTVTRQVTNFQKTRRKIDIAQKRIVTITSYRTTILTNRCAFRFFAKKTFRVDIDRMNRLKDDSEDE